MVRQERFPSIRSQIRLYGECPRCKGNLILNAYDTFCLQCGYYLVVDTHYITTNNYRLGR